MIHSSQSQIDVPAVSVDSLSKTYGKTKALNAVSLSVCTGEMTALIGPSGSGKSTLLRHICGLVRSDRGSGNVFVHGRLVQRAGKISHGVQSIRRDIGFVFQQFNLVDRLPLITNVLIGLLSRTPVWRSIPRIFTHVEKLSAMRAMCRVGIAEYAAQRSSTLSGGQQQRAAIARAILQNARVILADEPIASLDPSAARQVMALLHDLNRIDGVTVIVSLHQVEYALNYCTRVVAMKQGTIAFDGSPDQLDTDLLSTIYGGQALNNHDPAPASEIPVSTQKIHVVSKAEA